MKDNRNFFEEKEFEEYIKSFPKYRKKHPNKYEEGIREYLTKNRSARLMEIVTGCEQYGLKFEAFDPKCMFYYSLKNLVKSGHITKKDKIYIWNYKE